MLEAEVRELRKKKDILLMTHIVLGYPSFEACRRLVAQMVDNGVDLMELQIPFSEPIADGPVILRANAEALAAGSSVQRCLDFASAVTARFDVPFVFVAYYNTLVRFGIRNFVRDMAARGVRGAIVPDLPPEEGEEYLAAMKEAGVEPILLFAPTSTADRLRYLASHARGFVYGLSRRGVTGAETSFSTDLEQDLARYRAATPLPLAVGFGVKDRKDVDFLIGKADIAIVGSHALRVIDEQGVEAVGPFVKSLRA